MQSTIFHLGSQTSIVQKLRDSLKRHVYHGLTPELCNVEDLASDAVTNRYFKLIQAASNPGLRFSVTRQEYMAHRLYIVYHYITSGAIDATSCFPAVALNWRMVLIPTAIRQRISYAPLFRDLDSDGLIEINFNHDEEIENALARIAKSLSAETMRDLTAAASYMPAGTSTDIEAVAKRAGVDAGYVQHALQSPGQNRVPGQSVTCDLQPRVLPFGRWTKLELRIENHRDEELRGVTIAVRGPVKVRPQSMVVNLDAGSVAMIPVALLPDDKGEFPLEVQLFVNSEGAPRQWLPVHYVWVCSD
jgi:hypothetical protein